MHHFRANISCCTLPRAVESVLSQGKSVGFYLGHLLALQQPHFLHPNQQTRQQVSLMSTSLWRTAFSPLSALHKFYAAEKRVHFSFATSALEVEWPSEKEHCDIVSYFNGRITKALSRRREKQLANHAVP